jgi:DNA-binding FrmR family transcriptional regulator
MTHAIPENAKLLNRLRSIRGKFEKVERMLEREKKDGIDVLEFVATVRVTSTGSTSRRKQTTRTGATLATRWST